jgi:hypothetical protein
MSSSPGSASSSSSVFPLPSFLVPPPTRSSSRGLRWRRSQLRAAYQMANTCILSLNLLYFNCSLAALPSVPSVSYPLSSSSTSSIRSISSSTCRVLAHVFRSARRFVAESRLRKSTPSKAAAPGQVGTSPSVPAFVQATRQFIVHELSPSRHQSVSPKTDVTRSSLLATFSSVPMSLPTFYSLPFSALPIIAAQMSLPDIPQKVNMLDLLPPLMRHLYSTPELLLLPSSSLPTSPSVRPRVFGSKAEYLQLIRRMYLLGMISFLSNPKCVNGVFAVKKDASSQRLIIDARPANARFRPPPGVRLPDPSALLQLSIPADETLYVAKNDIKDFYHSILLPEWLIPYFGLPAVSLSELGLPGVVSDSDSASGVLHPVCLTVPMGWSHAVLVAQIDHEHTLYRNHTLSPKHNLLTMLVFTPSLPDNTAAHAIYIDDGPTFSTSKSLCNADHVSMQECYRENDLQAKLPKCKSATSDAIDVLGLEWNGREKTVGASVPKLHELCAVTLSYLRRGSITGVQLSRLVGSWVWPLLVRRPALSALRHVYRFIHCAGSKSYQLWPSVKRELLMLIGLAPLLYVDLSSLFYSSIYMSDASSTGGGVVSTPLSSSLADLLWPMTCLPPSCSPCPAETVPSPSSLPPIHLLQPSMTTAFRSDERHIARAHDSITESEWQAVAAWGWKHTEDVHINQLELQSVLTVVKRVMSCPAGLNSRVFVGTDSTVALHALRRGRTSSHHLSPVLCRIHASCLASGMRLHTFWIPSDVNPADAPSRLHS